MQNEKMVTFKVTVSVSDREKLKEILRKEGKTMSSYCREHIKTKISENK